MAKHIKAPLILIILALALHGSISASTKATDFQSQISAFIDKMVKEHHFDRKELNTFFQDAKPNKRILEVIAKPAEAKPWFEYRPIFVNKPRIKGGITFWDKNAATLQRAEEEYGVPPEIVTAILGVETRYGKGIGSFRVFDALGTLAFGYPPRTEFFSKELEQFLILAREEDMDPTYAKGSYAGAMGQPQFMPSSFRRYAVDFDKNGRRDIWNSPVDTIGSVANYLNAHGWERGQKIASRANINGNNYKPVLEKGLKPATPVKQLAKHGITVSEKLPGDKHAALIELETNAGPEYWVGLQNFYTITRYNHSSRYAMAVFQLAMEIRKGQHQY